VIELRFCKRELTQSRGAHVQKASSITAFWRVAGGDLLGFDLDRREFGEFLMYFCKIVAARDPVARITSSLVPAISPLHLCARGKAGEADAHGGGRTGQKCAARDPDDFSCCTLPEVACFVRILAPGRVA